MNNYNCKNFKSFQFCFWLFAVCICACSNPNQENPVNNTSSTIEYYLLKEYDFKSEAQVQITDDYLKNQYVPSLQKMGLKNIGVFKLHPSDEDSLLKTFVLIPSKNINTLIQLDEKIDQASSQTNISSAYINAPHDNPPYQRISTTLLRAFKDMPVLRAPSFDTPFAKRIYELRSYESSNEKIYRAKVDMFNAGGEIDLFEELDFNAVFYADVISGTKMPKLMYMTSFKDRTTRDSYWQNFGNSEGWKKMSALPKYQNTVSHADIYLLHPTPYSAY